jgi:hypothetical protein
MKTLLLSKILILTLILSFSLPVFGQQITGISIIPENPTSLDSIKCVISGWVPNPCIQLASGICPPVGDSLTIILYDSTCPPPDSSLCPPVVTEFSLEVKIGVLPAGSYSLEAIVFRRWEEWVFCPFPRFSRLFCKTSWWQDSTGYHNYACCWVGDCPIDIAYLSFTVNEATSVPLEQNESANAFQLYQNYPNPFNPTTNIEFLLSKSGQVRIEVFNILGQKVRTLVDEHLRAGYKVVDWDGRDDSGKEASSGIYFYRIKTSEFSQTQKMVLLR